MQTKTILILSYILVINLITFILYGVDKKRAKHNEWRVRERTLFLFPIIGGSIGGILGMRVFHHKTKHWYFKFGLPLILLLQLGIIGYFYFS